jgi:hypothetical protein
VLALGDGLSEGDCVGIGVAVGVRVGVAATVGVGVAGRSVGAAVDPQAARPTKAIAAPTMAVTFMSCLHPFNGNASSAVTSFIGLAEDT